MFASYFSSLKKTYLFMVCFGLLMGIVFPFYSALFFGSGAFNPFYVAGCLIAGLLVGLFSYFCVKQSLRVFLEKQMLTLSQIAGDRESSIAGAGADELQAMISCNEQLIQRLLKMLDSLTLVSSEIVQLYRKLKAEADQMAVANSEQVQKSRAALQAVEGMQSSFLQISSQVEQLSSSFGQQVDIAGQMKDAAKAVSGNMEKYSSSVEATSVSMEEMLYSVRETRSSVDELASSTEQTVSSIFQISRSIGQVRDHVNRTAACSEDVQLRAMAGMESMAATLMAINEIEESSNISFESISRLAVQTEQVGQVLAIIHDVVKQTSLLSLNASIIAAQAGEHGRSFAVVAGQVSELARRTSQSAGEIEQLLRDIREETIRVHQNVRLGRDKAAEGVRVAGVTSDSLEKISESAAEVLEMVRRIVSASDEEAQGSQLISKEAEKNLERLKQVLRGVDEQSQSYGQIVAMLGQMERLTKSSSGVIQGQLKTVTSFTEGVQKDEISIRSLHEKAVEEGMAAGTVVEFVEETGRLIEVNAGKAATIISDIEAIARLTQQLEDELAGFRSSSRS